MWVVALHAELDQLLDTPVQVSSATLLQDCITNNHLHLLQET